MQNKDFSIDFYGKNTLRLVAFNARLANKLNKNLRYYLDDKGNPARIKDGEEPIFLISHKDINLVSILLPKSYDRDFIKQKMIDKLDSDANKQEETK